MAIENLQNLERINQLRAEHPSKAEFNGLILSGQRRLIDV
jgi:hypothetical protein